MSQLEGKTALVSGGVGEIGLQIGTELAIRGATVGLVDMLPTEEGRSRIAKSGAASQFDIAYHKVDVADRDQIQQLVASLETIDIVVGNAGVVSSAPFLDVEAADWQRHLDVNLTGCFNLGQLAARRMVDRGIQGSIVFTGSWVQDVPWPEITAYSVSKAGVKMLARQMARELAEHYIRVNVVAPGIVNAGMSRRQIEEEPQYAERVKGRIPLGRLQSKSDIANSVAFLCSREAQAITGTTLLVDGGLSLFKFD